MDMIKAIMAKRRNRKGDHEGTLDLEPLAEGYEDSDMHDEDFLSQDGDEMEMDMEHGSNEMGNEDQEEARREAKMRRMRRVMSMPRKPVEMGHGDDDAPGKF